MNEREKCIVLEADEFACKVQMKYVKWTMINADHVGVEL